MRLRYIRNSQGVALLAALFVLMVLSILGIGLLTNVDDEIKMSKSAENSEMALKIAEAGVQIARSTFVDPAVTEVTQTEEFSSIDGFYRGGYFLVQMESGFQGAEKWVQWRYDEGVTGHNPVSEISAPVFHVWRTGAQGVNGSWDGTGWRNFSLRPIYGIVARGTYFPIENIGGDTEVRAHDEYTGDERVKRDDEDFSALYYWTYDKALTNFKTSGTPTYNTSSDIGSVVAYAVEMSPMVSFSNYSSKTGKIEPVLDQQTLYFVYTGNSNNPPDGAGTTTDMTSTVRLRAVNALCHGGANPTYEPDGAPLKALWEFDTGMHGIGTAPAFVDPDPDTPGDEIIYFALVSRGVAGSSGALDLNGTNSRRFPSLATDDPEQIYLFAVVDTTGKPADCSASAKGTYKVKWARPFPDPDVVEWTDYPTEHATGTDGYDFPYISRPDDMTPFLPEEDLLVDYRDGPGKDEQWNQIRGNLFGGDEPGVSPLVVKVLYRDGSGNLTENRALTTVIDKFDPIIDIYLMYSALTRVTYLRGANGNHWYAETLLGYHGAGWGPPGYRKPNTGQVRMLALRDQLVSVKDGTGDHTGWNWKAAKSRYPTFKWTTPVPPWDPDQTAASPDERPGNGYGEYTWDTWFPGQISPMVNTLAWNEDETAWANVVDPTGTVSQAGGTENLYNIIYPYYKSSGFVTGGANINDTNPGRRGPDDNASNPTEDSPVDFSGDQWTDSRVMVMAFRDTWDDYMVKNRTNILGSNNANPALSNPVEPYWIHVDDNADPNTGLLTYNPTLNAQYNATSAPVSKIGFPRPYAWWEALWTANIRQADTDEDHSLYKQGWENVISGTSLSDRDVSLDPDIEGETAAMCTGCLQGHGLLVLPFNHDLDSDNNGVFYETTDREDLRIHAIDATTGLHVWDYHMPAAFSGDDANNTPAIANNLVFVAYQQYGDKAIQANRRTLMTILSADDGIEQQTIAVDQDSDAVILPPTIANGAVYVGTYSFEGTYGDSAASLSDDWIRLFAMSPVIRLVSTGVYPFDYPGAEYPLGYKHYTGGSYPFAKITSLDHDKIFMNPTTVRGVWKRKLQVWVTGQNSKWEEVREVLEE